MFRAVDIYHRAILFLPLPWVGKLFVFFVYFYRLTPSLFHVSFSLFVSFVALEELSESEREFVAPAFTLVGSILTIASSSP